MKSYYKNMKAGFNSGTLINISIVLVILVTVLMLSACGPKNTRVKYGKAASELIAQFKQLKSFEKRFEAGNTPLLIATERNMIEVVRYLLKRGSNVNAKNKNGTTALMMAASRRNGDITSLLIGKKAKVNLTDKFGYTAMFYAVERKSAAVIQKLLKAGAKPNIRAEFGWTVIMVLAGESDSYLETIKMFHARGVSLNAAENQFGLTALSINSMLQGNISVFRYLVDNGANINRIDKVHRTPLLYAMVNKNYAKVSYLIKKGANPRIGLYKGLTPLMLAAARGDSLLVKILVDHGAKPMFRNKHGKTAIDYARKKRYRGIMSYLKRH